jgi:serine protease Do
MNRLLLSVRCLLLLLGILSLRSLQAQDIRSQEIIIQRDGDRENRISIEVIGDSVWVNGKPMDKDSMEGFYFRKRSIPFGNDDDLFSFDMDGWMNGSPFNGNGRFRSNKTDSLAFLGVQTEQDESGARITSIEAGSAAEKAGLKTGDVITQLQELPVTDPASLSKIVQAQKPGAVVQINYIRKRKKKKTEATLGARVGSVSRSGSFDLNNENVFSFRMPDLFNNPNDERPDEFRFRNRSGQPSLGLKIQDTQDESGVMVLEVNAASLASESGLQKGDLITDIADQPVKNTDDARLALRSAEGQSSYVIRYRRNGESREATVRIPKKLKTTEL